MCLQETYLESEGKIPYLWRGNFHLTPGNGHSCGCLTLVSSHINIIGAQNVESRANVLACQKVGENGTSFIIANIYAPCPNTNEKIDFYEKVFDTVSEFEEKFNCSKCLIAGDFNLNMNENEMKNRLFSAQERRIAKLVRTLARDSSLEDCWDTTKGYTWRRPNTDTFSTIDRILFSKNDFKMIDCKTNWSLGFSDHAAVEASLNLSRVTPLPRTRMIRLHPTLAKDPSTKTAIIEGVEEMMSAVPDHWDPHMKL